MKRTNVPTSCIHTEYFGHTHTLSLALFGVLLQNLDLDALLAPRKSVFDSAIPMGSLVTEYLKPSLSGTFFQLIFGNLGHFLSKLPQVWVT